MRPNTRIALLVATCAMAGCLTMQIDSAIERFEQAAPSVSLGDPKARVLGLLLPTQEELPRSASKRSESFIRDGTVVEVYYFRSSRQADGLTTDDEFTPYVFNDGRLVGIGWSAIGGPKTQGQAPDTTIQTVIVR